MADFSCDMRIKDKCECCSEDLEELLLDLKVEKFCYKNHFSSIVPHGNYDENDCVYGFCNDTLQSKIPSAVSRINSVIFDLDIKIKNPVFYDVEDDETKCKIIVDDLIYDDNNTGVFIFYDGEDEDPVIENIGDNHFICKCHDRNEKSFIFTKGLHDSFHIIGRIYNDFKVGDVSQIVAIQNIAIQNLLKKQKTKDDKIAALEADMAAVKRKIDL
tara:strand:- start:3576 stop:4220 length:645 start_codon:yes stop_codon:yes gene_type:complete